MARTQQGGGTLGTIVFFFFLNRHNSSLVLLTSPRTVAEGCVCSDQAVAGAVCTGFLTMHKFMPYIIISVFKISYTVCLVGDSLLVTWRALKSGLQC